VIVHYSWEDDSEVFQQSKLASGWCHLCEHCLQTQAVDVMPSLRLIVVGYLSSLLIRDLPSFAQTCNGCKDGKELLYM